MSKFIYKINILFAIIIMFSACSGKKQSPSNKKNQTIPESANFFTGGVVGKSLNSLSKLYVFNSDFEVKESEVDLTINLLKTATDEIRLEIFKASEKSELVGIYSQTRNKTIKLDNNEDNSYQTFSYDIKGTSKNFELDIYWYKHMHIAILSGDDFSISYLKGLEADNYNIIKNVSYSGKSAGFVHIKSDTPKKYNMSGDVLVTVTDTTSLKFHFSKNRIYDTNNEYAFYDLSSNAKYSTSSSSFSASSSFIIEKTSERVNETSDNGTIVQKEIEIPVIDPTFKLDQSEILRSNLNGKFFGKGQQLGSIFSIVATKLLINGIIGANKK